MSIASSYDSFIKASAVTPPEFKQITFFSTLPMEEKQNVQKEIAKVFNFCSDADMFLANKLLEEDPILLWDRETILKKTGVYDVITHDVNQANVYNSPHGIIVSKLDTLKILNKLKCTFIPETVFTREEAKEKLTFPIIAKASNTFQSRGVEKVSTKRSLSSLGKGFDIYQEQIEIKEEFRVLFFRGKQGIVMMSAFLRDPQNNKAKDLRTNEAAGDGMKFSRLKSKEKSNFAWTQINPSKHRGINVATCYEIANVVFAINPTLNVGGFDIAVDDKGKHFFIEVNSTPGLFSNTIPLLYKFIYEDSYGSPLSTYAIKRLKELSFYFAYLTKIDEPTFSVEDESLLNIFSGYRD
jgi:glutathione synthase/RimK-type ligase-like ATP-grasp enzyme